VWVTATVGVVWIAWVVVGGGAGTTGWGRGAGGVVVVLCVVVVEAGAGSGEGFGVVPAPAAAANPALASAVKTTAAATRRVSGSVRLDCPTRTPPGGHPDAAGPHGTCRLNAVESDPKPSSL
jgi:hypothetical protein